VDVKHNETSHFTELLEPVYLAGAVVKRNQPLLHVRIMALPWRQVPARQHHPRGRARPHRDPHPEGCPRQPPGFPARPPGPQDQPPTRGHRHRQGLPPAVYALTSLTSAHATVQDLARLVREHWSIEGAPPHPRRDLRRRHLGQPGPATGLSTWPPSAPPLSRPSRTPATCTSPKGHRDHTTPAQALRLHDLD
jgi:hypothetical protein